MTREDRQRGKRRTRQEPDFAEGSPILPSLSDYPTLLAIPPVAGEASDIPNLVRFLKDVRTKYLASHYHIDFSEVTRPSPATVVLIGAALRAAEERGTRVHIRTPTIRAGVQAILKQNGFLHAFAVGDRVGHGSTITYREDRTLDVNDIIRYLKSELLARNFLAMTEETQDLIAGRLAEIYVNAFDHAGSPVGVLTCGHYKKATKQVQLAALDLGIGIPGSVGRFFKQQKRRPPIGDEAMRWAFQRGTTTKPGLVTRGNGLHLLVELISRYHGFMEVRSNEGRVVIEREGTTFGRTPVGISGTLIRLTLCCDTAPFDIGDAQDEPLF